LSLERDWTACIPSVYSENGTAKLLAEDGPDGLVRRPVDCQALGKNLILGVPWEAIMVCAPEALETSLDAIELQREMDGNCV